MGRVYTVGNSKGGVGKSTIVVQLAAERAKMGKDVLVINGDRQRSAEYAMLARGQNEAVPGISFAAYPEGETLAIQVRQQRKKYDEIIIDVGGRDSSALRAALGVSDVLLVPFQPRSFESWALEDMAALISSVRASREEPLPAYAILNLADPGALSADNRDAEKSLADFPQMQFLNKPLVRRKSFSNASGLGLSVSEMKPSDPKAVHELNALMKAFFID